ncbi:MAG: hypothetical protein QW061_02200 [Candidatus Rehaiarchaeum fermentans]|nr:hypothetical protein [Candidatus Rehaiarchaeum fermentans]MCW1297455.1 hypothetical protein [Candidatus Rehaiarchaeum fermentans]
MDNYSIQPSNQQNLTPSLPIAPTPTPSITSGNQSNPQNGPNNNSNNTKKNYLLIYEIVAIIVIVVAAVLAVYYEVPVSPGAALEKFITNVPNGVHVYKNNYTIVISSNDVTLPIVAYQNISYNPVHNISYPTNTSNPFLQTDNDELPYFSVYGVIDPTIIINKGTTVHFVFINFAPEEHVFAISPQGPPFQLLGPNGTFSPASLHKDLLFLPALPPPSNISNPFEGQVYTTSGSYTFNQTGTFYYLCPIPGHAQLGMWGEIKVI